MSLADDLASDFDSILSDFGVSVTMSGTTTAFSAVKNSMDKDIVYGEIAHKSVEYKFTLWFDSADFTAASVAVPDVHDELTTGGKTYLIGQRTYDPLDKLVAFDLVEQYG
jgi:hypothetical protein